MHMNNGVIGIRQANSWLKKQTTVQICIGIIITKDNISTKSGNLGRESLGWHRGCKRWQITRRGWGGGGGVAGHGHKNDTSAKSGNLGREGLGRHRGCPLVAHLAAVTAIRVRFPASCQILYIKVKISGRRADPPKPWEQKEFFF